jgi:hypothetical protein
MSKDDRVPFKCPECGLLARVRGCEVRINDTESESNCKHGQNPNGCPSLKEEASIVRQFAAIQASSPASGSNASRALAFVHARPGGDGTRLRSVRAKGGAFSPATLASNSSPRKAPRRRRAAVRDASAAHA